MNLPGLWYIPWQSPLLQAMRQMYTFLEAECAPIFQQEKCLVEKWIEGGGTLWISGGHQIEEVNRRIFGTYQKEPECVPSYLAV